jgi:hypothetical protein
MRLARSSRPQGALHLTALHTGMGNLSIHQEVGPSEFRPPSRIKKEQTAPPGSAPRGRIGNTTISRSSECTAMK